MADYKSFDDYFNYSLDKQFGEVRPEPPEQIDVGGSIGVIPIPSTEDAKDSFGTVVKSGYATAKGAVQGELGVLGELEHLWNGITSIYNTPEGKSKVDSFLEGLSKETALPDTERMKAILNKAVPEANKDYTIAESIGEVTAPGALLTGLAAKGAKALKGAKDVLQSTSKVTAQPIETKSLIEQKNKPIWSKEPLSLTQEKRLVPEGASANLYRQMSNSSLMELLQGRNTGIGDDSMNEYDLYFATNKAMALGQGYNAKGPVVEFNSFDTLIPSKKKAADDFITKQTGVPSEVVIEDAKDLRGIRDKIKSIEFPKGSDDVKDIRSAQSPWYIINSLQTQQWKKKIMPDGKILLTPPIKPLGGKKANK